MHGKAIAVDTAIGRVPAINALDTDGLDIDPRTLADLLLVDNDAWQAEIPLIEKHLKSIGERLPSDLNNELRELEKRLAGPA